jgi:hypothetical protein
MFSLKPPSLLSFREQTRQERRNLRALYHLTDIPGDTQMRATLDPVSPTPLRALFATLFATLQAAGVVKEYQYWQHHVIVAIDGVEHFPRPRFIARIARGARTETARFLITTPDWPPSSSTPALKKSSP